MRNGEMVDTMVRSAIAADQKPRADAIDRLTEASYGVAAAAGGLAPLMTTSWKWWLPGRQRLREQMLMVVTPQVTTQLGEVLKASETLRSLEPDLDQPVVDLATAVVDLFQTSLGGDLKAATKGGAEVRRQVLALRAEADQLQMAATTPSAPRRLRDQLRQRAAHLDPATVELGGEA